MEEKWTVKLLILLACTIPFSAASQVLLLPYEVRSRAMVMVHVSQALIQKGHHITAVISEQWEPPEQLHKLGIKIMRYKIKNVESFHSAISTVHEIIRTSLNPDHVAEGPGIVEAGRISASNLLGDSKLFKALEVMNFDLAIMDNFPPIWGFYLLPKRLGIPYVTVQSILTPLVTGVPTLPSFVPYPYGRHSNRMSFTERFRNTLDYMTEGMMCLALNHINRETIKHYAPATNHSSLCNLISESKLWLLDKDDVLDYPKPTMPNVIAIPGLSTKPAQELEPSLRNIVSAAKQGIIVVSFGSVVADFPHNRAIPEKLLSAFRRLKQTVFWRYQGAPLSEVPNNVILLKWLPQNDLLGYNNTRLFITHCGNNGQYEALFHGVPMIGFPLITTSDQTYNCMRAQERGFGFKMDIRTFTADQLLNNIQRVITDTSYAERIKKASRIFKSFPMTSKERAGFWIDHILTHGSDHLQSPAATMPLYQLLMVDIVALVVIACHLGGYVLVRAFCFCARRWRRNVSDVKVKEQ